MVILVALSFHLTAATSRPAECVRPLKLMETPQHPRRRVRSSHDAPAQTADAESTTPEEIPAAQLPGDFAAGFVNIYDALTPRQISVISLS